MFLSIMYFSFRFGTPVSFATSPMVLPVTLKLFIFLLLFNFYAKTGRYRLSSTFSTHVLPSGICEGPTQPQTAAKLGPITCDEIFANLNWRSLVKYVQKLRLLPPVESRRISSAHLVILRLSSLLCLLCLLLLM